jgi:EGF-like domain
MKKFFKLIPMVAVAASSFFFAGCPVDPCDPKKVDCGANGTCLEGLCTCAAGYEGDKCDLLSRTKMIYNAYNVTGTYSVDSAGVRTTNAAAQSYVSDITAGAKDAEVKVSKFADYGSVALVVSSVNVNKLTIAPQTLGGSEFSGTGVYDPATKKVSFTYKVTKGVFVETGTLLYTR